MVPATPIRGLASKLGAVLLAIAVVVLWAAQGHAVPAHYTDGATFQGKANYGPPIKPPSFKESCRTLYVDPPGYVWVTIHFVYGATPPPSNLTPVHDDASAVVDYPGAAPGTFWVDVSQSVEGKRGWLALTWNLGTGVTAWVPFDCRDPAPSPTTIAAEGTTVDPSSTTTATAGVPVSSTAPTATATATVVRSTGQLPFTGGYTETLMFTAIGLVAAGALLARRRTRMHD